MLVYQGLVLFCLTLFASADGYGESAGRYPYHVIIRSRGRHICSGSIINKRHILTAYSCVDGYSARDLVVVAGTNSLDEIGVQYRIREIIGPDNSNDDIALLRTYHDIDFDHNVRPIEITSYNYKREGYPMTMTAFKKPPSGRPFTNKLQVYKYEIHDGYQCKGRYIGANDKFLCFIKSDGESVCNADFGGAIVANNYIIGIKIPGDKCVGKKPEVHLRVHHYSSWIKRNSNLWENDDRHYDNSYDDYHFRFRLYG